MRLRTLVRQALRATRPVDPHTRQVLEDRWAALPSGVRTPAQLLGRHAVGCEGTQGVFPQCNLTCSPCYHSKDANKVRTDGAHTLEQVRRQMGLLRRLRGPRAHAQLIGGEVSLLSPDDHAAALLAMRDAGREPMSMTHGDFDYAYLERLVLDASGAVRLRRVSFAAHFDSMMRGRRGVPRPRHERDLHQARADFVAMFDTLRARHGVRSYLAHNMTVTPTNLEQVPEVVAHVTHLGYQMMSFQPAALVGDDRRWGPDYQDVDIDAVWRRLESGLGQEVSWRALQLGDTRCNRTAFGVMVGQRWHAVCHDQHPVELRARDAFLDHFGGMSFGGTPPPLLLLKIVRVVTHHPGDVGVAARWLRSFLSRAGGVRLVLSAARRGRIRPVTFVVHSFMDAADVAPAWEMMRAGIVADEPSVKATQERLSACTYAMAHPETGELVPACVQHSVLDPAQNVELRRLLPLTVLR